MHTAATALALTGSDQQAVTGPGTFRGLTLNETASSAAEVRVYDGTDATGTLLASVALTADGSADLDLPAGRRFATGLWVDIVAGTVVGSVFLG